MRARIGLIGCGEWGKFILRDLKSLDCHVSVVAYAEKDRQNAAKEHADETVENTQRLRRIEGLVIATPATTHAQVVSSAAQAHPDIPIFLEKPMTTSVSEAKSLAERFGDRLFMMHKWRYHPGILALADIVARKSLGQLQGIRLTRVDTSHNHPDTDVVWTCLPHDLSILIAILGYMPSPVSAVATKWGHEVMELTAIWGSSPWVVTEASAIRQVKQREIRVECEQGVALLRDGDSDSVEIYRRTGSGTLLSTKSEVVPLSDEMPLKAELREFVSYLQDGPRPRASAHEGLGIVIAVSAVRALAGIEEVGRPA
jgi:predicted dehydrogenase